MARQRTPEQVLQQVVALLNKTVERGATPAEAAAAAAKAQGLMFAYNLTTADVDKSKRGTLRIQEGSFGLRTDTWQGEHEWQQYLLRAVCRYNFTMVLSSKEEWNPKAVAGRGAWVTSHVTVLGTPENIAITEYLYAYLYRQVVELAKQARKQALAAAKERHLAAYGHLENPDGYTWRADHFRPSDYGLVSDVPWLRSFGDGAVEEIAEKLRLQRLGDEQQARPEDGALIVTIQREVEEEWYQRKYGKSKAAYTAEQEAKRKRYEEEAKAAAERRAAQHAEDERLITAGLMKRPKAPKVPRYRSYSSGPREVTSWEAQEAGRKAGREIAIREGVNTTEAPARPELGA